jgi:hypothetical protein
MFNPETCQIEIYDAQDYTEDMLLARPIHTVDYIHCDITNYAAKSQMIALLDMYVSTIRTKVTSRPSTECLVVKKQIRARANQVIMIHDIVGFNIFDTTIYPDVDFPMATPTLPENLHYQAALYQFTHSHGFTPEPFDKVLAGICVTAANLEGLYKAMKKIQKDPLTFSLGNTKHGWTAYALLAKEYHFEKLAACNWKANFDAYSKEKVALTKAAGIQVFPTFFEKTPADKKKRIAFDPTYNYAKTMVAEIYKFAESVSISDPLYYPKLSQFLDTLPTPIAQASIKRELRVDGQEDKVRIFFIVPLLQHLLTQVTFEPIHQILQNSSDNFLSFNWFRGGWRQLYSYIGPNQNENTWFEYDVTGMDTTATPWFIAMYLRMALVTHKTPFAQDTLALVPLVTWLFRHTALHTVEWTTNIWKQVFGVLLSGDYNTSSFNTFCMQILFRAYKVHLVHEHHVDKEIFNPDTHLLTHAIQGDNGLIRAHVSIASIVDRTFVPYLASWGKTVRPNTWLKYNNFYSDVDIKTGPSFLQRHFTPQGPARPYETYVKKIFGSTDPMTYDQIAAKAIGLAWDTFGTSPHSYELLQAVHYWALSKADKPLKKEYIQDRMHKKLLYVYGLRPADIDVIFPSLQEIALARDEPNGVQLPPHFKHVLWPEARTLQPNYYWVPDHA